MNPGSGPEGTHITEDNSINKKRKPGLATKAWDELAHLVNSVGVKKKFLKKVLIVFIHIFPWKPGSVGCHVKKKKHIM